MTKNAKLIPVIAIAIVLTIVLVAVIWVFAANVLIGGHLYPKRAEYLNLREEKITLEEYNQIQKKLRSVEEIDRTSAMEILGLDDGDEVEE